jgi:hypothetical protein
VIAISVGAFVTPILLSAFGLTSSLVILGCAVPILSALAYPRMRGLETRALRDQPDSDKHLAALASLHVFSGVSRDTLRHLAQAGFEEHMGTGVVLFRSDAAGDDVFVLTAGEVELSTLDKNGPVETRKPLFCFGAVPWNVNERPATTVTTIAASTVFRMPCVDVASALESTKVSHPALRRAKGGLPGGEVRSGGLHGVAAPNALGRPRSRIDSSQSG